MMFAFLTKRMYIFLHSPGWQSSHTLFEYVHLLQTKEQWESPIIDHKTFCIVIKTVQIVKSHTSIGGIKEASIFVFV